MSKPEPLISKLFTVMKRKLKAKAITYRDVAYALDATEVSVKRWFAEERLSIRQVSIIANMIGLTMTGLMQEAEEPPVQQFTLEQEQALIKDFRLLLILRCALSNMSVMEIVATYQFTEAECIKYLIQLDRMRIIDLLPGNQIRMRVARDYDFLANGPIKQYILDKVMPKFMDCDFQGPYEDMVLLRANLTFDAMKQFQVYLRHLRRQLAELHEECFSAPLEQCHRFGVSIAYRNWEVDEFASQRRPKKPGTQHNDE